VSLEDDVLDIPGLDNPVSELEQAEERSLVRQALDALPSQDRDIFFNITTMHRP